MSRVNGRPGAIAVGRCLAAFMTVLLGMPAAAQVNAPKPKVYEPKPLPTGPSRMEKLQDGRIRIGPVLVDREHREVSVSGVVNDVPVLEFLMNTKDGYKSYESAIEAECTAVDFGVGLILIGLDKARTTARPRFHFDPVPPAGDPVEIWVSWTTPDGPRRVRAEDLLWDTMRKAALGPTHWVYTGSAFVDGQRGLLADRDGVLVGFVHTPAPLIERVETVPAPYGAIGINPDFGLKPGTAVTVTVRALRK